MNIEYNGISYFIKQNENEFKKSFIKRAWYIAKTKPINDAEFNLSIKKSNIYSNIKNLECQYNINLENQVL